MAAAALALALAGTAAARGAAQSPAPGLPQAVADLQQQKWDDALAVLEPLSKSQPDNPRVWMLLGLAYHGKKDLDRALAAHMKAAEFPATRPAALYNIAMVHALRGKKDLAFEWLEKAKATGKVDLTRLESDPDAAALRDDPRLKALLPTAADFADPFVEPATIIHEWDGEAADDQFGWIARDIGDVDGDGADDIVTSAPSRSAGGAKNAGEVYVYSGKSGKRLWAAAGRAGEQLGLGVEAASDVDKDGVPDVVAGAPGGDRAYLYSGRDGRVIRVLEAPQKGSGFGRHVADAGDVNGDGYADVDRRARRSTTPAARTPAARTSTRARTARSC